MSQILMQDRVFLTYSSFGGVTNAGHKEANLLSGILLRHGVEKCREFFGTIKQIRTKCHVWMKEA